MWSDVLQERRNDKIGILTVFIMNWRDVAGGQATCVVSRRCIWGHWAEVGEQLLLEQHTASAFACPKKVPQPSAWTRSCFTASSASQGGLLGVDPFAVLLRAALPGAGGHPRQGSPEMCLSAWPPPSPGLGTEEVVGTDTQPRTRRVGCLGGGGFLQLRQLCQVKVLHRRICHGALLR